MAGVEAGDSIQSLSTLFDRGYALYKKLADTDLATSSPEFQDIVRGGIECFESCTKLVNTLSLFSRNEDLDELPTTSIRYLLLPCLLGYLTTKVVSEEKCDRLPLVQCAQVYYTDYLLRCNEYGVSVGAGDGGSGGDGERINIPPDPTTSHAAGDTAGRRNLAALCESRERKISAYRECQDRERRIASYERLIDTQPPQGLDDDKLRSYYILLVTHWAHKAIDDLNAIYMEKQFLQMAPPTSLSSQQPQAVAKTGTVKPAPAQISSIKYMPVVLGGASGAGSASRRALYQSVFGMGYPSLPTVSIEEWAEREMREGRMPTMPAHQPPMGGANTGDDSGGSESAAAAARKEALEEADDADTLREARRWDDWRDDHKRGYGNTMNKG